MLSERHTTGDADPLRHPRRGAGNGTLVVLSGPAGVGKSTVADRVCKQCGIRRSVSATTREPRPGEVNGRDYFFVTEEQFKEHIARGELLEHARVHGRLYGTPRAPIEEAIAAGESRMLVIDVQGAVQVREQCPEALCIFLDAPDDATLEQRLCGRGTEEPEEQAVRLAAARRERGYRAQYDYCVINDNLDRAVAEVSQIIATGGKPKDRRHRLNG